MSTLEKIIFILQYSLRHFFRKEIMDVIHHFIKTKLHKCSDLLWVNCTHYSNLNSHIPIYVFSWSPSLITSKSSYCAIYISSYTVFPTIQFSLIGYHWVTSKLVGWNVLSLFSQLSIALSAAPVFFWSSRPTAWTYLWLPQFFAASSLHILNLFSTMSLGLSPPSPVGSICTTVSARSYRCCNDDGSPFSGLFIVILLFL